MGCKKAPGKIARHHVFNDIIWRAVGAAGIPAVKESSGLDRQDGKRPDGLTLISWYGGRSLVWDVTVVSPLAASYVNRAATVADMTATRKTEKYSTISSAYRFEAIAVLGIFSFTTLNSAAEFVFTQEMRGKLRTYSNAFLSCYNASTPCFCTTLCHLTCRTSDHPTF